MYDLLHRLALALLVAVGAATLAGIGRFDAAATLATEHRQLMLGLLAGALLLAPWIPVLRGPAVAAALLSKASLLALAWGAAGGQSLGRFAFDALQLVALAAAATILLVEARREARWNGMLPLRREG